MLEPTAAESKLLQMIYGGDMPKTRAKRVLLNINTRIVRSSEDMCERLAAPLGLFPDEVHRKAPDGRRLRDALRAFAAPERLCCCISPTCSLLLCAGTLALLCCDVLIAPSKLVASPIDANSKRA